MINIKKMSTNIEYGISKISLGLNGLIETIIAHEVQGDTMMEGIERNRSWLVINQILGKSIFTIKKDRFGYWVPIKPVIYENNYFKWYGPVPKNLPKRKTFVSFYHNDDEEKRKEFDFFFDDLFISKSVHDGDINPENSDPYIKSLIQKGYLNDTTVQVVLVGPNTKCRKHVDWEIYGALDFKVGDKYAGLLGLLLPTHPDFGKNEYNSNLLPKRLAENVKSGYAILKDWTEDRQKMQNYIEEAIANRSNTDQIENKTIPQMKIDTCS
jgi:hypothetical protein